MRCPILGFLPEIADVADHWEGPKSEAKLLAVARNICQACRQKEAKRECPLGERFGSTLQCRLPRIFKVVGRLLKEKGD